MPYIKIPRSFLAHEINPVSAKSVFHPVSPRTDGKKPDDSIIIYHVRRVVKSELYLLCKTAQIGLPAAGRDRPRCLLICLFAFEEVLIDLVNLRLRH